MISYPLSIITPSGKVFDGQVESLIAPGESGFFGILRNHAPIVASLKGGPLTIKQNSYDHFFAVSTGVLEVNAKSEVLLLTDYAAKVETYEAAKTFVAESEISAQ